MANEKQDAAAERDELAFQLYSARAAILPAGRAGERQAEDAYRQAEAFLAVRARVRTGAVKPAKPEGPQLADCSVPNCKPTHPLNLVSQRFGNLDKVNRIKQWLDRNPPTPDEPEVATARLNNEYNLDWDTPQANLARAVFPAYARPAAAKG